MKRDLDKLVANMSLEEKASLCSGRDFWHTKEIKSIGLPSIMMTDGPHGMRKQSEKADMVGVNDSIPATCFPSGAGLAASWNVEVFSRVAAAMAQEAKSEKVSILLGPAVCMKRSPLCGRNFEYLSEDPFLAGRLAASYVKSMQGAGVGTSIKHYAANNQEKRRMLIDTVVDERTLREIYLPAFEHAVKEAQPWTVMCAYNKLNGTYCSQHEWLLDKVLKKEWGLEGIVVTDWGACDDRIAGLEAGQDLEMPSSGGVNDRKIVQAVRSGKLKESVLDASVKRLLGVIYKGIDNLVEKASYDKAEHHKLAREVAAECMVLLKNEGDILPLKKKGKIAFLGEFAEKPRYQGGGSSHINPTHMDKALDEARKLVGSAAEIVYERGYDLAKQGSDPGLLAAAKAAAKDADAAVVFLGLTDAEESEGYDRSHLRISEAHIALLEAAAEVNDKVIVVLSNGSPVEMPWLGKAKAVLEGYLAGQASGGAVADILFGAANPSGKLAETFPKRLEDTPCYLSFPGDDEKVEYREGLFIGYRYYDSAKVEPLFPFGHGLSYARFEYSALELDKNSAKDSESIVATCTVKNTGAVAGKEALQLYVRELESEVVRPIKELKGFAKVELEPGESRRVSFSLDKRSFATWDEVDGDWSVESGDFLVMVGASSADIRLEAKVRITSTSPRKRAYTRNSAIADLIADPKMKGVADKIVAHFSAAFGVKEDDPSFALMVENLTKEMPIRSMASFGMSFGDDFIDALVDALNGKGDIAALEARIK
jgi:beta-glucosidase